MFVPRFDKLKKLSGCVLVHFLLVLLLQTETIFSVNLSTFRSLFTRMRQLQLSMLPNKVIQNASVESCAAGCVKETDFECKSFDYDNAIRACHLYNNTHEDIVAILKVASNVDHYRSAFEKLFNRLPNQVVTISHNRKVPRVSVEECARRCVFEMQFHCRGFDYEQEQKNCWLTDDTPQSSGGVRMRQGVDYYEKRKDGPLSKYVCYGFGSLPPMEGYQIYNKVMLGVTLDACAQLCTAETSFQCASFDYMFNNKACHMSQYVAANVRGMDTDVSPQYKVMHYEKKEKFLEYFYATPYAVVLGHNKKTYHRVTPNRCARNCLEQRDFVCRSFDYQIEEGTCLLSTKTGSDVGGLYYQGLAQVHHFEMKPFLDCGGVLTSESGNFASPNWPRNYAHHLNCSWQIRVPRYKVILFTFVHFDLGRQTRNPCDNANDKLVIEELTTHGLVRFCAALHLGGYVSQANNVTMQFVTNAQHDAQGFRITYKSDWPCHALLVEDNGEFASPGWPAQYPANSDCLWTIHAPHNAKVYLRFTSIDLEPHGVGHCSERYDSVEVYDGDSPVAPILKRFCGSETPQSVTSSYNILLIKFTSDSRVERTGFHATYMFVYRRTTTTTTETPSTTPKPRIEYSNLPAHSDLIHKALTAMFFEPAPESPDNNNKFSTKSYTVFSTTTYTVNIKKDDNDGSGNEVDRTDIHLSNTIFIKTMWILVASLLVLLILVMLILALVCRHYRRRIPKRRNVPNFPFSEENLSLYEKKNAADVEHEDHDCLDTITSEPDMDLMLDPDIAFSNPMYDQRYPSSVEDNDASHLSNG